MGQDKTDIKNRLNRGAMEEIETEGTTENPFHTGKETKKQRTYHLTQTTINLIDKMNQELNDLNKSEIVEQAVKFAYKKFKSS